MKFYIKPERVEAFKRYMAKKLTEQTDKIYYPSNIGVRQVDINGVPEEIYIIDDDVYRYVFGDVDFKHYQKPTIKNVEYIYGDVNLNNNIQSLGSLTFINGSMTIEGKTFKDFGNLKYIKGNLILKNVEIESLNNIEYIGGYLYIINSKIAKISGLNNGNIEASSSQIGSFENIQTLRNLIIKKSTIPSLGNLENVKQDVLINFSKIEDLGELKVVERNLNLYGTDIDNLGKIEYVGGNLNLKETSINKLGNLKYVGNYLELSKKQKLLFNKKICKYDGKIVFRNDPLINRKKYVKELEDRENSEIFPHYPDLVSRCW